MAEALDILRLKAFLLKAASPDCGRPALLTER